MTFVLSNIVEVLMNKIALWITVRVDECTAERVIIASNVDILISFSCFCF